MNEQEFKEINVLEVSELSRKFKLILKNVEKC